MLRTFEGLDGRRWSQGIGSFVTVDFYAKGDELRAGSQHSLWVYLADWELSMAGEVLAHAESAREHIGQALARVEGATLVRFEVDERIAESLLSFEKGVELRLFPYLDAEPDDTLWVASFPSGHLSMGMGGEFFIEGPTPGPAVGGASGER